MPAVAGAFYPSSSEALRSEIERCFLHRIGPGRLPRRVDGERKPLFLISPHAGYVYSGPVAAQGYLQLEDRVKPDVVVVLGPNHYGIGSPVSVYPEGEWITPLGSVEIDSGLAMKLVDLSDIFTLDEVSHLREHSIEVQVPFLQYILGEFKLLPICILDQELETCLEVGRALAEALRNYGNFLVVASTDLTHYEADEVAKRKDRLALEKIIRLDSEGLYDVIARHDISMCGYGPVAAILEASRRLGAKKAEIMKHATSGDVTGDRDAVVGYASVKIELED
ncbi:MAG: AmmeMemoRadiSam system protein B [Nitrososphaeria archaeon]|nr:AmmeMemoRadiSam system protein B [Aigarchaeota archaeon]MCX8187223.1 AmmeMemoRadiSam system protein B [Nitrososphaeria archaeon]